MPNSPLVLTRTSEPTKQDVAPFGSMCIVINGFVKTTYVQLSKDENDPRWEMASVNTLDTEQAIIDDAVAKMLNQ